MSEVKEATVNVILRLAAALNIVAISYEHGQLEVMQIDRELYKIRNAITEVQSMIAKDGA